MWKEMARIIHEVQPRFAFVENSPMLTSRGLGRVLGDLAAMGFDARWGVLGAKDIGANHQRDRIWICAKWRGQLPHTQHHRIRRWEQQQESIKETINVSNPSEIREQWECSIQTDGCSGSIIGQNNAENAKESKNVGEVQELANTNSAQRQGNKRPKREITERANIGSSSWWQAEPNVGRVADGLAARVDRLKAIGNGQVPLCAATAWRVLNAP
jgi:DNA (cytosine-5)-methyltransferase 1